MAKPPKVIVLIDKPKYLKTKAVNRIETGIAVNEMRTGRIVPKKKYSTTATKIDAPMSLPSKVLMDASIKLACLNVTFGASMPVGKPCFNSAIADSIFFVSTTVSAEGCFCTPRMTAGPPS